MKIPAGYLNKLAQVMRSKRGGLIGGAIVARKDVRCEQLQRV
jgi:hypothetical protein